ncbi:MAG: trigger factor [Candidatus Nitrospinota bacterium M3_3B_026]
MKIQLEEVKPCVKKITVEVPAEKVSEEKSAIYRELARTATAPGFRKGRVPMSILEKMYSKSVLGDAAQRLIQSAYREAIDTHNLRPVGDPMVDEIKVEDDQPLTFTATVETFPEVELKDVSGVSLKREIQKVDETEIDRIIDHYRERQARFEPVEDRAVEEGDFAIIDYSAERDGAPVENFRGENKQVQVSEDNMLAGFYSGVIGMSRGEAGEFKAALPKEFPDPELAGAELDFKVKVNEIKRKVLPEADDQLASEVSEFDTMDGFREDLRGLLEKRARDAADNDLREALLSRLIEDNPFELAPSLVERQAEALAQRYEQRLKSQGIDLAEAGYTGEALKEKSAEEAERMLKEQVILSAYGRKKGIEVGEEDINAEVEKIAGMMGQTAEMTRRQLAESDGLSGVARQAFSEKVYAAIMDEITIEDTIVEKAENEKPDS